MREDGESLLDGLSLENVIEAMADPVTIISTSYEVVLVNKAARSLFCGRASAPLPGKCHEASHHRATPCEGGEHPCPMQEARNTRSAVRVLHTHYSGEGQRRVVQITASPLWARDGSFAGIVESQQDVTEREQFLEERERHTAALEQSNRLKDLFVDILRHDMLNPAWHIHVLAHALAERPDSGALRDDLRVIDRSARKLSDMIQNASTLARLEGGVELPMEDIDLAQLLGEAARDLAAEAAGRGMSIVLPDVKSCVCRANPLIADVFHNLLSNAVKYGRPGTEIKVELVDGEGQWRVAVSDRGEGIPEEAKERIFSRFTRLSKGEVKGTGLGLAIVKRVVEAHHGSVSVRDNPGGGSVFEVCMAKSPAGEEESRS